MAEPMADWEVRMALVNAMNLFDRMTLEEWQAFVFPDMKPEV
jgi:hypothetical protein